jgi:hypothetical protein
LESSDPAALVRRLEEYGFAALYLNRKGYEDRADALLSELAALGYDRRIEGALGNQVVVPLRPALRPALPRARQLTLGRGWHPRSEDGARWAYADAVLSYHNPASRPQAFNLQFWLSAPDVQTVTLLLENHPLAAFNIGPETRLCPLPRLTLKPGVNRFELRSDRPARRHGSGRYQLRAFALHRMTIAPADPVTTLAAMER